MCILKWVLKVDKGCPKSGQRSLKGIIIVGKGCPKVDKGSKSD